MEGILKEAHHFERSLAQNWERKGFITIWVSLLVCNYIIVALTKMIILLYRCIIGPIKRYVCNTRLIVAPLKLIQVVFCLERVCLNGLNVAVIARAVELSAHVAVRHSAERVIKFYKNLGNHFLVL